MALSLTEKVVETFSNDNSVSTNEFLHIEKTCEGFKDSDEEIKSIFNEINKLSAASPVANDAGSDLEDVDLILKKAEDLANETKNILKSSPMCSNNPKVPNFSINREVVNIPLIKVTKPKDSEYCEALKSPKSTKIGQLTKQNAKENSNEQPRRKQKARPASAGIIDVKKKEIAKFSRNINSSPKRTLSCKHESLIEELKDTTEKVRTLELMNVQLTDDSKALRKKLNEINEQKHLGDLKLAECEKFISRLGKEYENRSSELKSAKENESRLIAELNKERNERKNLSTQHEKDVIVVHDLQRQCKEMEMILKRKHPDSVSALIVASKSSSVEDNKKKLLEERVIQLEQELKDKEDHFQGILLTLQEKFGDMKQKYENHLIDVERQLMDDRKTNSELKNKLYKLNLVTTAVQTVAVCKTSIATQTLVLRPSERASSAVSRLTQNSSIILNKLKEDSYLVATIKGLQGELTVKQRTIAKINRETEDLRKNLRNLQREKEVLMNLNPQKRVACRQAKSSDNILVKINGEMEADLAELRKQKEVLMLERNSLLDSLKRTNEEFILLKKKRIQDLHTLQVAHEKELMQMNMQVYPLQEENQLLNRTVDILKERVRNNEDSMVRNGMKDAKQYGGGDNARNAVKY